MDGALETVEEVALTLQNYFKRVVVTVPAGFTMLHLTLHRFPAPALALDGSEAESCRHSTPPLSEVRGGSQYR